MTADDLMRWAAAIFLAGFAIIALIYLAFELRTYIQKGGSGK